ncbi:MAG: hypothetical protein LC751_07450 [Actinobacteria bacterium]|nr:hypothetical protein [Actinomycetota bacterium]
MGLFLLVLPLLLRAPDLVWRFVYPLLVLAAYNSGEGQVDTWVSEGVFEAGRDIPFKETRDYVDEVLETRDIYAELYGSDLDRRSG